MILQKPQTVNFDPNNTTHREAVCMFLKRNAWVDSPIRFTHDPAYASIADQVKDKLLKWYIAKDSSRKSK